MTFRPHLPEPPRVLVPGALYLGDNGRCFCTGHAGATALYTGRDVSGHSVHRLTAAEIAREKAAGWEPRCETCAALERRRAR